MIDAVMGLVTGASLVGIVWIWRAFSPKLAFRKLIRGRYAVTLKGGDGEFAGVLTEMTWRTLVFEDCQTVAQKPTDSTQSIIGKVRIDRANVAYLQELSNDLV
jgi:hypothetical protein